MKLEDLCGDRTLNAIRTDVRHPFDADANGVAIELDNHVIFIFEDPSDGYRSSAATPLFGLGSLYEYAATPVYIRVPVTVAMRTGTSEGIQLTDRRNGKVVLEVGTDNTDDYYPSYICNWMPQNIAENAAD